MGPAKLLERRNSIHQRYKKRRRERQVSLLYEFQAEAYGHEKTSCSRAERPSGQPVAAGQNRRGGDGMEEEEATAEH